MTHQLKIHPEHFKNVSLGLKKVEIRFNDRNYQENDILILNEFDPINQKYTGFVITRKIDFIIKNVPGLEPNYVALQILKLL